MNTDVITHQLKVNNMLSFSVLYIYIYIYIYIYSIVIVSRLILHFLMYFPRFSLCLKIVHFKVKRINILT